MTLTAALALPVVFPVTGAVLSPLAAHLHRRLPLAVGVAAMLGSAVVLGIVAGRVFGGDGRVLAHFFSNERPVHGRALGVGFAADPFGLTFALLASGLGLLLLVHALSELSELGPRELGGLAALMQLLLAALIGAALTADTVNLFVWFEVAALASYGLTGFFLERPVALEAAFKVLVLTSVASFAVFIGAAMLYDRTGALNLGQLQRALPGHVGNADLVALALLITGYATKAGLVPFHTWLPDAHTPVPGAVSALFSGLMVNLGIVALVRLALQVYPSGHRVLGLLTVLGAASAVIGAVLALAQDDLKRLLAWDTVSQMGVLTIGFASATPSGVAGATYHLVNHGLFKALLFLCAGAIVHATGETSIWRMGGLARHRPLITAGFTVGVAAIAGIPPLNGFASLGLIHEGVRHEPVVFAIAVITQVVTVAALSRAAYLAFYRRRTQPYEHLEPSRLGMRVALLTLGASCLAFGALAGFVVERVAAPAASIVLHPATYATAVLQGTGNVPPLHVDFAYGNVGDLLLTAAQVLVGLLVATWYVQLREPLPVRVLRRVHTGSVNDYAAFATCGLVVTALVLLV